jgi:signal peptidase I
MSHRTKRQVLAVSIFALVALFFVVTFRLAVVKGDSMLPTYRDGQMLLVSRITGSLERGDVVLVKAANDVLIKRIAYLPGDEIPPREAFAFRRVRDYFEVSRRAGVPPDLSPLKVPAGYLVVLGDNRAVSEDSRVFGPVAFGDVLGRVVNAARR